MHHTRAGGLLAAILIVVATGFTQTCFGETLNARAGLWSIKTTAGGLRTPITKCVTAEDFANPERIANAFGHPFNAMVSRMPESGWATERDQVTQKCTYSELKQSSDSIHFKYEC